MAFFGIPWVLRALQQVSNAAWAPIVPYPVLRSDSKGDGHFGSSRTGHVHQGVDIEVSKGETIYAPISGTVTRVVYPYADDFAWKGVEVAGSGTWDGYKIKIFYMQPDIGLIGSFVDRGQPIGLAQAISEKYTPAMKNHVHVELRKNGQVVDPTQYIFPTP